MKENRTKRTAAREADDMLPEYDFSKGERAGYAGALMNGYTITVHHSDGSVERKFVPPPPRPVQLDPEMARHFPDSKSVNSALRVIVRAMEEAKQKKFSPKKIKIRWVSPGKKGARKAVSAKDASARAKP